MPHMKEWDNCVLVQQITMHCGNEAGELIKSKLNKIAKYCIVYYAMGVWS